MSELRYRCVLISTLAAVLAHGCDRGKQDMCNSRIAESWIDRPDILAVVFHPRPEYGQAQNDKNVEEFLIPVDQDVVIGARFYPSHEKHPVILFFHGNGEIAADYDDIARYYTQMNVNFLPVDYRGYGKSTGQPTITAMLKDARKIYTYIRALLSERGYAGCFVVMGRSLGSASALELAAAYPDDIDGLIIESGFAQIMPLLQRLGADVRSLDVEQEPVLQQANKIRAFARPILIIHADQDHIIPFSDAEELYNASPSAEKRLIKISGADHNSLMAVGFQTYMQAVSSFLDSLQNRPRPREKT